MLQINEIKIIISIIILVSAQIALKYTSSTFASVIAALPIIALLTYFSSTTPTQTALHLAIFLFIGSILFFMIYVMQETRYVPIALLLWGIIVFIVFKKLN